MIQIVIRTTTTTTIIIIIIVINIIIIPSQFNVEVHQDGNEAEERSLVEGGAVDAEEEVEAVYSLEVVDHGNNNIRLLL